MHLIKTCAQFFHDQNVESALDTEPISLRYALNSLKMSEYFKLLVKTVEVLLTFLFEFYCDFKAGLDAGAFEDHSESSITYLLFENVFSKSLRFSESFSI